MEFLAAALKWLGWRGLVGLAAVAILTTMLLIQKGETRHWKKQSDRYETLYNQDKAAFAKTVAGYRAAYSKAVADDAANLKRVQQDQATVNQQREASYEARIADARTRADRLQRDAEARAHPGGPGSAPVPGLPAAPGGVAPGAPQAGLSADDALVATEQAIQLDELIHWVHAQHEVNVSGPTPRDMGTPRHR
jgi:hypothetical protein